MTRTMTQIREFIQQELGERKQTVALDGKRFERLKKDQVKLKAARKLLSGGTATATNSSGKETTTCGPVDEVIQDQLAPIEKEVSELSKQLKTDRQEIEILEAVLKAMSRKKAAKNGKKGQPAKPFADKKIVLEVCTTIVKENSPIAKADVEALAKDKLGNDLGYSLSCVQVLLNKCLQSEAFVLAENDLVSVSGSLPNADRAKASAKQKQSRGQSEPVQSMIENSVDESK